jgi:hypothetical protein
MTVVLVLCTIFLTLGLSSRLTSGAKQLVALLAAVVALASILVQFPAA